MPNPEIIDCWGDALTFGVRSTRGWPEHLWAELHAAGRPAIVRNNGLPGHAKAQDVLRAINASSVRGDVAILACPAYDAYGSGTPPKEYAALLSQAFFVLSTRYERVYGCTPTPVRAAGEGQPRSFGRHSRRWHSKGLKAAMEAMGPYCEEQVNLHEIPLGMLCDGVHPNPDGYQWISHRIFQAIQK